MVVKEMKMIKTRRFPSLRYFCLGLLLTAVFWALSGSNVGQTEAVINVLIVGDLLAEQADDKNLLAIKQIINEQRQKNRSVIVVSNGNLYSANADWKAIDNQLASIDLLASALASTELRATMTELKDATLVGDFAWLAANVKDKEGNIPAAISPYITVRTSGKNIVFLGLIADGGMFSQNQDWQVTKSLQAAADSIQFFADNSDSIGRPDAFLLLSHIPVLLNNPDDDMVEIIALSMLPGVDAIIGGGGAEAAEKQAVVNDTLLVQPAGKGKAIGWLQIIFNDNNRKQLVYKTIEVAAQ